MWLKQKQAMGISLDWDDFLTESESNPYPLAPSDLLEAGLVTKKQYSDQNWSLARFVCQVMTAELSQLNQPGKRIEILGAGLLRDLAWIPHAILKIEYQVVITDGSTVACENARQRLRKWHLARHVMVRQMAVEEAWETGQIDETQVAAYYGGQFIQVQDMDTMWAMMTHFGEFLANSNGAVYLLHARGEDNDPEKVQWGKSTPYFQEYLETPLEVGADGRVKIQVVGQHMYFHQKYSLLRIRIA